MKNISGIRYIKGICPGLLLISLLHGCATLDKNECLNADWQSIGYQDGYKGYRQSRIGKHQGACAEYGVKPDLDLYLAGYKKGIYEYCEPYRGYQRGLQGYSFKDVCTAELRARYKFAYTEGKQIYDFEQEIAKTQQAIDEHYKELDHLEHERGVAENQLINDKLSKLERKELVKKIRVLDHKKQRALDAIQEHERALAGLSGEVEHLKTHSRFGGAIRK